ncbi:MAG: hypothetical protein PHC34_11075 [Candidatus Gastranaerophilales bacterium]|nr:hypothetical protein [Candidatus Gastranaerophilales bacterium]
MLSNSEIVEAKVILQLKTLTKKYENYLPEEHKKQFNKDVYGLWRLFEAELYCLKMLEFKPAA